MTSRQKKQAKRSEKTFDDIISGKIKAGMPERPKRQAQANRKGGGVPDTESENEMVEGYLRLLKFLLPGAVAKLSTLEDPRCEKMCDHSLPTLIIYGLLMFIINIPSRRAANRDIGGESVHEMLKQVFPGLETIPHADTLARLLKRIDADEIELRYEATIIEFIKSKTFLELNPGHCLIAIDGTGKFTRKYRFDEKALVRNRGDEGKEYYCAYVLESVLILENGMILPLFTEFLENADGELDDNTKKQDCEHRAFIRLTDKIRKHIGKGRVTLVVDGLFANGPVVSRCKSFGWEFMITLKRGSLKSVWEEFDGLRKCEPENIIHNITDLDRNQTFKWSNGIEYTYGKNHKKLNLNIVTCKEEWQELHPRSGGKPELKVSDYAWISSSKITLKNVIRLCNNIARKRWRIENHFHVEKHQGYSYSHCYSYNWNAMRGFHSLMKFAHFINSLILGSVFTSEYVSTLGSRWYIKKVWDLLKYRGVCIERAELLKIGTVIKKRGCVFRDIKPRVA
jgi:hypothetical protein